MEILKKLSNFFTLEPNADAAIKQWLQTEYKKDWHGAYVQFKMDGNGKKPLKTKITNFYKLHMNIIGVKWALG